MDGDLSASNNATSKSSDGNHGGENGHKKNKKDGDDKEDFQDDNKSQLGRSVQPQGQKQCSKYCVLTIMTIMKVTLLSSVCLVVAVGLEQFCGGCEVEAVAVVEKGHVRHHHGNWYEGRGEIRGLDRLMERLEGRGPPLENIGRRERRDNEKNSSGGTDQGRGVKKEEEIIMDHHRHNHQRQPPLPILPSSSSTPRGHSNQMNGKEEEEDQDLNDESDEDENYEDDDDDDNYDDHHHNDEDDLVVANDKISQWAEKYKSGYLARKTNNVSSTTTTTPAPPSSTTTEKLSYSQWKWKHLGTREGLEQHRRQTLLANRNNNNNHHHGHGRSSFSPTISPHYYPHQPSRHANHTTSRTSPAAASEISEAIQHAMRVKVEAECKNPRGRVVRVQDLYPNPSKSYIPHCTILHQCSDDTGCCRQQSEVCAPKKTQRVELPFYSIALDQSRDPIVERLVFYNHTECECRDRMDEMMPRDQSYSPSHQHHHRREDDDEVSSSPPPSKRDSASFTRNLVKVVDDRDKKKNSLCKCPSVFSKRPLPGDACSCDCFDGQTDCLHLKLGRDFFNLSDKWCIQSGQCEIPECAFGSYIHLVGRCPQKHDLDGDSTSWTKYLSS